jgi:hypothetical protein
MPVSWTIAGQSGRNFDATARSLESASISSARLEFKNLEADILTFTISPSPTGAIFPDLAQEMILYRDGVQFFVGHVTDIRTMIDSLNQSVQVTVSGTWWWLDKVPMTAVWNDGAGTSGERISIVFGSATAGQNLKTSLENAINRSAALGIPIATIAQGSSVDNMFAFPRITLNQSTCGQVISELVRICPDTMVWFDYSTKPVRIRITRRGNAPVTALDALSSPIVSIDINPRIDLQVSQVTLPYVDRSATGLTRFQSQSSGTNYLSQRQVITISGPELDTFLPNDLFESYSIKTQGITGTDVYNFVHDSDNSMVNAAKVHGLTRVPAVIDPGGTYTEYSDVAFRNASQITTIAAPRLTLRDNTVVSTSTNYIFLSTGAIPDWLRGLGYNIREATFSGHYRWGPTTTTFAAAQYFYTAGFDTTTALGGYFKGSTQVRYQGWKSFSVPVIISTSNFATATTVYRPSDYSFMYPPEGLAGNLLAAQNWLPYEGQIQLEQQDVGATRYRGTKVNLANSLSSFANMGALVKGESIEIETGRTTISLGAPARNDYRTLVDKVRKTSQDNIVYV